MENIISVLCHFMRVTKEFFITLLSSLFPVIIGAFSLVLWADIEFMKGFLQNFRSGELFMYSSAFLAPYLVNRLKEETKGIVKEASFWVFLYALLMGAMLFLSIRIEDTLPLTMKITNEKLELLSLSILFSTIYIWYFSVWPNHRAPVSTSQMNQNQIDQLNHDIDKRLGK